MGIVDLLEVLDLLVAQHLLLHCVVVFIVIVVTKYVGRAVFLQNGHVITVLFFLRPLVPSIAKVFVLVRSVHLLEVLDLLISDLLLLHLIGILIVVVVTE